MTSPPNRSTVDAAGVFHVGVKSGSSRVIHTHTHRQLWCTGGVNRARSV